MSDTQAKADRIITLKLNEHIKRMGVTQKEFAVISGLREATISNLVNNKLNRVQLSHLLTIMDTLGINDFNDILAIKPDE